ncbi:MAG: conserved membrane protein of unknown function [Promethearchaeota archaeon]|nr:MAG: conserved membrane protein of unknown function [Candidatus Lokiarchaeota archaeon]
MIKIEDTRIILTLLWVATMLVYLLGDVMRIFAGDFTPGEIEGKKTSSSMWLGISAIMVLPIIMIVLTLLLGNPLIKWINIIMAIFFLVFNLVGIKGYKSYDVFLLIVSFGFNIIVVLYAWNWI